jgi:hypothetical protein
MPLMMKNVQGEHNYTTGADGSVARLSVINCILVISPGAVLHSFRGGIRVRILCRIQRCCWLCPPEPKRVLATIARQSPNACAKAIWCRRRSCSKVFSTSCASEASTICRVANGFDAFRRGRRQENRRFSPRAQRSSRKSRSSVSGGMR